jgi:AcrR family transcriptional regulator
MSAEQTRGRRGPPKAFDIDSALDAAMLVFWQKGFEGTSLSDLTEAMGINRPSLYATFGDKQSLFRRAVDRFVEQGQSVFVESEAELTARRFAERLLRGQADLYTDPKRPPGCFLIQSAISTSTAAQAARQETAERRLMNEMAVRRHLERADRINQLPPGLTPSELAAYLASVSNGLAIRAADGAKREELHRIVDLALAFWPTTAVESAPAEGGQIIENKGKRRRTKG